MIRFGSLCSGIEAASIAFLPLGWKAEWFSEIEPFPCAVLTHHYPTIPNHGNMLGILCLMRTGVVRAVDVLCGGTPCQAFSVAGKRESLDDDRGNLSLTFCEIADENDLQRQAAGLLPAVIVWENVPGVLSTKDNAFGCFLGQLAGEDCPLVAPGNKWPNAGVVVGPKRAIAWRVLDAQYFGVAQRRRRVFVVASAREGFDPAEVLFEFDGVRRDTPPSREAGQETAGTLASRTDGGGFPGTDEACSGYVQPVGRSAVMRMATGQGGAEILTEQSPPLTCNHESPIAFDSRQDTVSSTEVFGALGSASPQAQAVCVTGDITHTLKAEGFDASEDGTGRGQPIVAAFQSSQSGVRLSDTYATLDANNGPRRHNGALVDMAVRRLTPRECERLQGFPDDYTLITVRGKPAADGPRYKALGNSWAVPNVHWIGRRIHAALMSLEAAC